MSSTFRALAFVLGLAAISPAAYALDNQTYTDQIELAASSTQADRYEDIYPIKPEQACLSRTSHCASGLTLSISQTPDWDGLVEDTELFMLYQVAVVGVLYFLPESVSKWDEDAKNGDPFKKWDDNVNNLGRDGDDWIINYVGHPYFGATYYTRARIRGYDRQQSFWYAVGMSTIYEYGVEAFMEPVSVQDLIFTPVAGTVVGEYFMIGRQRILNRIAKTGKKSTWDSLGLFFTDPIGVINHAVMKSFRKHTAHATLNIQPIFASAALNKTLGASNDRQANINTYGIQALVRW